MSDFGKICDYKGYKVQGWFSGNQMKWYQSEAQQVLNGTIVEVGVYGGLSLLSIADVCRNNQTKLYGVDPWEAFESMKNKEGKLLSEESASVWRDIFKGCRENLEKIIQELKYDITLIQEASPTAANRFDNDSLDLVFIDGDHNTDSVINDLRGWYPKVKKGKCLGGHDFDWASVFAAVNQFCQENEIQYSNPEKNIWKIVK